MTTTRHRPAGPDADRWLDAEIPLDDALSGLVDRVGRAAADGAFEVAVPFPSSAPTPSMVARPAATNRRSSDGRCVGEACIARRIPRPARR